MTAHQVTLSCGLIGTYSWRNNLVAGLCSRLSLQAKREKLFPEEKEAPSTQSYGALSVLPIRDSSERPSLSGFVRGKSLLLDRPRCEKLLLKFVSAEGFLESFDKFHYTLKNYRLLTLYSIVVFETRTTSAVL